MRQMLINSILCVQVELLDNLFRSTSLEAVNTNTDSTGSDQGGSKIVNQIVNTRINR